MKLKDLIKKSVDSHDLKTLCGVVEELRTKHRLDYRGMAHIFEKHAGLDADRFEGLMQELDEYEAHNED